MGARSVVYQLLASQDLTSPHYHLIISFLPHQTGGGVNVPDVLADLEVAGVKPGVIEGGQLAQRGTKGVESPGIQHCEMLMRLLCPSVPPCHKIHVCPVVGRPLLTAPLPRSRSQAVVRL